MSLLPRHPPHRVIPMRPGIDSLAVGAATAVVCYVAAAKDSGELHAPTRSTRDVGEVVRVAGPNFLDVAEHLSQVHAKGLRRAVVCSSGDLVHDRAMLREHPVEGVRQGERCPSRAIQVSLGG